ncbi:MAG: tRNA preQ1(34) S-adenosylmethionine ribosyltransferase-isomerase QueA, partial [Victivallales bacterium]|nr:tRNA preQ1(34) S-adenosylmethionine ribosyltransferase-isomerase QueA [Victivallales bacterium]
MLTSDFDYDLPEELIAQFPSEKRGASRMMVLNRSTGEREIRGFVDLPEYLRAGDCVVVNNTKVMKARFFGIKAETGAKIEILLTTPLDDSSTRWRALVKPGKRVRSGTVVELIPREGGGEGENVGVASQRRNALTCIQRQSVSGELENRGENGRASLIVESVNGDGTFDVAFDPLLLEEIERCYGHTPLPPYIKRGDVDSDDIRYQTVFAKEFGAVAAPTAGLHFTNAMLAKLAEMGVFKAEVTLHVGPGTFRPVSVENPDDHKMHYERFSLTSENAAIINGARKNGGRVLAIGTTCVRVLETCAASDGTVSAESGTTNIFMRPPAIPKATDMLLTNFHLPKSTLLMLVATFADLEDVLAAYEAAKSAGFSFYSYGDCMLVKV